MNTLKFPNRRSTDPMLEKLQDAFNAHQESCERKTDELIALVRDESSKAHEWRTSTTHEIADIHRQLKAAWPQIDAATEMRNELVRLAKWSGAIGTSLLALWELIGSHIKWF